MNAAGSASTRATSAARAAGVQVGRHHRLEALRGAAGREGRRDDELGQSSALRLPHRILPAPPVCRCRQRQLLTEQTLGDAGPEGCQARALEHAGAGCVGHHHFSGAQRLQQAGHPECRIGAQLERIEPFIVDAAQHDMHPLQTLHRLEEHLPIAHREVTAFDQRDAEVAREEDLLEVRFVQRTRGQQHDARPLARRCQRPQPVEPRLKRRGHALHVQFGKRFRKLACDGEPVFQQVAQSRRCLQALRQHPPAALGPAREIERRHVQVHATGRHDAVRRPQVLRVGEHQRRRQHGVAQQRLRAVYVGQRGIEQSRALHHTALDPGPLVGIDDEWQQLQRPRAARIALGGMHVVGGAVLAHALLHACGARGQFRRGRADAAQRLEEGAPHLTRRGFRRSRRVGAVAQFVERFLRGDTGPAQCPLRGAVQGLRGPLGRVIGHACIMPTMAFGGRPRSSGARSPAHQGRRRSSVSGNSLLRSAGASMRCAKPSPGEWPIAKKRPSRRLSASYALTGKVA